MQGINRPTAIQALAWPALYSGRDLMCIGLPTSSRVISVSCCFLRLVISMKTFHLFFIFLLVHMPSTRACEIKRS